MLSKKYRLPTSFFRARKRPVQSFAVEGVGARVYTSSLSYPRCAVIVPVKTAKKAVERNKIRRTVYDMLRTNLSKLPVFDFVFFVSDIENIKDNIKIAIQKLSSL